MAQHFLLSAAARTLKLKDIYRMSDDKAFQVFAEIRFAENGGEAFCPACGCCDPYFISTRRKWKCRACAKSFSATSGTIFASRKMAFVDLLAAICIFVNAAKGISALQLSRDLDCQYKTAYVLAHKLREAMARGNDAVTLTGTVEVDGAYFGGHVRPENRKEDRKDRRLAENRDPDRRVVVVLRERKGRTLPFVVKSEPEGVAIVKDRVAPGSGLHADEGTHWDPLEAMYDAHRINHSEAYSWDGACTNQAESYFSRLRRMVQGQHHHVSHRYLYQYAGEAAWREDNRRTDNKGLWRKTLGAALRAPVSRQWKGYWQRSAA
ncbi:MAG: IS1595 family transposase [Pseudomonadota bacterium]